MPTASRGEVQPPGTEMPPTPVRPDVELDVDPPYRAPLFLLRPPALPAVPFRLDLPSLEAPVSQLCTANQLDEPLYARLCAEMAIPPNRHRKLWEWAFILRVMQVAGMLAPGRRLLGFGTGREPLPSVFARSGATVLATDAPAEVNEGQGWQQTGEYSTAVRDLHRPDIVSEQAFMERVSFRPVDMNAVPDDLAGFDACWSSCCFEHLGSLAHGLDFVARSLDCLRPGGIAVHTTEFNLDSDDATFESPGLSIYRKRDIEALIARLVAAGHKVWPLNTHPGYGEVDQIVDLPPFDRALPHLKVKVRGIAATSIGLVVERRS